MSFNKMKCKFGSHLLFFAQSFLAKESIALVPKTRLFKSEQFSLGKKIILKGSIFSDIFLRLLIKANCKI